MEELIEKKNTFTLPKKTVKVMPIVRKNSWLPKGHDGEFLYTGSTMRLTVPLNSKTGQLVALLTEEEQEYLERALAKNKGDLSIYKQGKDNFWATKIVSLDKEGITLDLSFPDQYIQYKILQANKELIAPSFEERLNKGTYKYMFVEEDYTIKENVKNADLLQSVWMEFGAMRNDYNKLRNVLKLYRQKSIPVSTSLEFLISEVQKIVTENPNKFIEITKDPSFMMKAFIEDAIEAKAINKVGKNRYAIVGEPDDVYTLDQIIKELDPEGINSDKYMTIKAKIENK